MLMFLFDFLPQTVPELGFCFVFCGGRHTQQHSGALLRCSEATPIPVRRSDPQQCCGTINSAGDLNQARVHTRQTPQPPVLSLAPKF